jgi:hypothetical protein
MYFNNCTIGVAWRRELALHLELEILGTPELLDVDLDQNNGMWYKI